MPLALFIASSLLALYAIFDDDESEKPNAGISENSNRVGPDNRDPVASVDDPKLDSRGVVNAAKDEPKKDEPKV